MSACLTAVAAVVGSLFALAPSVSAADLDFPPDDYAQYEPGYEPGYESKRGAGYRRPRYADPYRDGAPPDVYAGQHEELEPGYPPPSASGKRFAEPHYVAPRLADREPRCVPRRVVRRRLRAAGWHDFNYFRPRGPVILVCARRPSGRPFNLAIDRCNGEIVEAHPVRRRHWRPFAFGPRRGRFWSY